MTARWSTTRARRVRAALTALGALGLLLSAALLATSLLLAPSARAATFADPTPTPTVTGTGQSQSPPPSTTDACNGAGGALGGACTNADPPSGNATPSTSLWTFFSDPTSAMKNAATSFASGVGGFFAKSTTVVVDQPAVLLVYGSTALLALMIGVGDVALTVGMNRSMIGKIWAFPGFLGFLLSLGLVPAIAIAFFEFAHTVAVWFVNLGGSGFNGLFTSITSLIQQNEPLPFGIAHNIGVDFVIAAVYMVIAVVLFLELILLGALQLFMIVIYPFFGRGFIYPKNGRPPSVNRKHMYSWFIVTFDVTIAQPLVAIVLSLAGQLVKPPMPVNNVFFALALLFVAIMVPFYVFALVPVADAAQIAVGLRAPAASQVRRATRAARSALG